MEQNYEINKWSHHYNQIDDVPWILNVRREAFLSKYCIVEQKSLSYDFDTSFDRKQNSEAVIEIAHKHDGLSLGVTERSIDDQSNGTDQNKSQNIAFKQLCA